MVQVTKNTKDNRFREEKNFLTNHILKKMREKGEEEYAMALAQTVNLPYVDLNILPLNTDFIRLIPERTAIQHKTGCFMRRGRVLYAVLTQPDNVDAKKVVQNIANENGWTVSWFIVSESSIQRLHDRYKKFSLFESLERMKLELSQDDFLSFQKQFAELFALKKNVLDMSTTEIFSLVISGAVSLRASDVHFEPQEEGVRMRYRLDGVLQDVGILPFESYKYILSRVKMMGKMKLNIRKSSQDGHFSVTVGTKDGDQKTRRIDVRASILPSRFGETIVMRLLEQGSVFIDMEDLGLRGYAYEQLQEELKKTTGMIVTTGPTGSGKTTLLYSILSELNESGVKIITIEDPVEYEMKNISQTNISLENGYTFSSGLRSIVRQDPDIILVGEMRDEDTAEIAVQASLTGHLVLTTLHTNSSAGSVPRLINLGIKPDLIPSAVNAFVAQRLVRRLCSHCSEDYIPAEKTSEMIMKILSLISPKAKISIPQKIEKLCRATGCLHCNYTGYKGRVGIFEVMFMTENVNALVKRMASEDEITAVAIEDGMITMTQDGILKAVEGVTSMEEVWRVGGQFKFLEEVYEKLMSRYLGNALFVANTITENFKKIVLKITEFEEYIKKFSEEEILQVIIGYALFLGAEDVHIEPEEEIIHIRFRIDGVLQSVMKMPSVRYPSFLGRIKLLSNIKTEEQAGLRDSRFTVKWEPEEIGKTESVDVRVSVILGGYGETAVLRLLNIGAQSRELSFLGMREETKSRLENAIRIPNGIILTTGPTGSGKSTTLYSILTKMNQPDKKIMTVEDPIEYRINGVLQTQTDESKGYGFSNALRSLLRQNPDIILVGEIRDEETAQMAVKSSLTGHLVFSTLHTNNAPSAIQRLVNMGISPNDLVTSVNFIMAQRLLRNLCDCKKKRSATEDEQREMKYFYTEYSKKGKKDDMPDFAFVYEPVGCELCRGIGYKGMSMISEGMDIKNEALSKVILNGGSGLDIQNTAIEQGMIPMVIDGIDKALAGITSLEEVRRVTEL